MGRYVEWLRTERGLDFPGYDELWRWSVTDLEGFWASIWDYFGVRAHTPYERVLGSREMPGAEWFPGATLNYAEHMLGRDEDLDTVAILATPRPARRASSRSASSASRWHGRAPA
jgi:acetoacetyl-CoA synthetase